jgi:peptidoglycan hydrolase-like protein with peptidoglycan-binding domain
MKLNRWITLLSFTGALASAPLFAQEIPSGQTGGMNGGTQAQQDVPWSDQQASLDAVKQLQQSLNDRGYDAGPVDGLVGPRTESALREFQQAQGLDASGEINADTLSALDIDSSEFAAFGIEEESVGQESPGAMDQGGMSGQESPGAMDQGGTSGMDSGGVSGDSNVPTR